MFKVGNIVEWKFRHNGPTHRGKVVHILPPNVLPENSVSNWLQIYQECRIEFDHTKPVKYLSYLVAIQGQNPSSKTRIYRPVTSKLSEVIFYTNEVNLNDFELIFTAGYSNHKTTPINQIDFQAKTILTAAGKLMTFSEFQNRRRKLFLKSSRIKPIDNAI
jgi:hypothetical protein